MEELARYHHRHHEEVMGTVVTVDLWCEPADRAAVLRGLAAARAGLHRVDAVFSTYRADSPMSRIRTGLLAVADAPPEIAVVLELCARARQLSGGAFDPWAMPGGVDPTGLVKGWAAEAACRRLALAGATAVMVNAGGDIALAGLPPGGGPWRVGISDPTAPARLVAVAAVTDAIATSGGAERGAHLIDPRSGHAVTAVVSATVVGESLAFADALATGLAVAGRPGLPAVAAAGYEGLVVTGDLRLVSTAAFPFAAPA
jgi:thiamine biosynthesis lipoprotein